MFKRILGDRSREGVMNYIDLELYRWKWHNEVYLKYKRVQELKKNCSKSLYWKEHGAFVSVLPRQIGKSKMLSKMVDIFKSREEDYFCIVPSLNHISLATKYNVPCSKMASARAWIVNKYGSGRPLHLHLLVDEFDYINKDDLMKLLDYDWNSVSMVSTLK